MVISKHFKQHEWNVKWEALTEKPGKMYQHTTQKVTGKMRPIEWRVHGKNWPHLKYMKFSQLAPCPMIDIYPYRNGLS